MDQVNVFLFYKLSLATMISGHESASAFHILGYCFILPSCCLHNNCGALSNINFVVAEPTDFTQQTKFAEFIGLVISSVFAMQRITYDYAASCRIRWRQ